MKNPFISIITAGLLVLIASVALLYGSIFLVSSLIEEYFEPVFRSTSFATDWLFYAHPFVLSAALYWFWEHSKAAFKGTPVSNAFRASMLYGAVGLVPVLWLTFSAINISALMVVTWILYGVIQTFVAFLVFANRDK